MHGRVHVRRDYSYVELDLHSPVRGKITLVVEVGRPASSLPMFGIVQDCTALQFERAFYTSISFDYFWIRLYLEVFWCRFHFFFQASYLECCLFGSCTMSWDPSDVVSLGNVDCYSSFESALL